MESFPRPKIGKGPDAGQDRYAVRVEQVRNEVVRTNESFPDFRDLPQESLNDFAYFAVDSNAPETDTTTYADFRPGHNRSLLWSRSEFVDSDGTKFRDLNIKGTGYVRLDSFRVLHPKKEILEPRPIEERANFSGGPVEGYSGLMSLEDATIDYEMGEKLAGLGIRASRGIAIIKLNEIYLPGEGMVSMDELHSGNPPRIREDFVPVVYVRAMGTDIRGNDFSDPSPLVKRADPSWLREKNKSALLDAVAMVESERGMEKGTLTLDAYTEWFAQTLGANIAKLHSNGLCHDSLTNNEYNDFMPQNVTLDCRIVDLDSVISLSPDEEERSWQREKDRRKARHVVMTVAWMCEKARKTERGKLKGGVDFVKKLGEMYDESYGAGLPATN